VDLGNGMFQFLCPLAADGMEYFRIAGN